MRLHNSLPKMLNVTTHCGSFLWLQPDQTRTKHDSCVWVNSNIIKSEFHRHCSVTSKEDFLINPIELCYAISRPKSRPGLYWNVLCPFQTHDLATKQKIIITSVAAGEWRLRMTVHICPAQNCTLVMAWTYSTVWRHNNCCVCFVSPFSYEILKVCGLN